MRKALVLVPFLLAGCPDSTPEDTSLDPGTDSSSDTLPPPDADGDGHVDAAAGGDDCDDANPNVFPGAVDACDEVDHDCDPSTNPTTGAILLGAAYATIADAVAAVPDGGAGPELTVCPGTYAEHITIERGVVLKSLGDATDTIIDAGGISLPVLIVGGNVTLEGFTLTNGRGANSSNSSGPIRVGGALAIDGGIVTLKNSVVQDSTATLGGGIGLLAGRLTLRGTTVQNNTATTSGGGVYVQDGILKVLEDSHILSNSSEGDGGGVYGWETTMTVEASTIANNSAQIGGGLFCSGFFAPCTVTSTATLYENNSTTGTTLGGGGLYLSGSASVFHVSGGAVRGNTSANAGGGLMVTDGSLTLDGGLTIEQNTAAADGGGVYMLTLTEATLTDVALTQNTGAMGAAIRGGADVIRFSGTTVSLNTSTDSGAPAAIDVASPDTVLTNVTIDANTGGGLMVWAGDSITLDSCTVTHQDGPGARVWGELISVNTDWGQGDTDNTPHDILNTFASTPADYDGVASFTCNDTGCQ